MTSNKKIQKKDIQKEEKTISKEGTVRFHSFSIKIRTQTNYYFRFYSVINAADLINSIPLPTYVSENGKTLSLGYYFSIEDLFC